MKVDFTVNGKAVSVDVPPDMPLLWVLRDTLSLKGTKYGCGEGQCGACTVHLRGRAVRSCQVEAKTVAGANVTTIEGLSPNGTHPLQVAWREVDVPECGYCQAGQIMAAAAYEILQKPVEYSGHFLIDDLVLADAGVRDFSAYSNVPGSQLALDLFIDGDTPTPPGVQIG